jgi:hypothetical protein
MPESYFQVLPPMVSSVGVMALGRAGASEAWVREGSRPIVCEVGMA